jgi:hypothetical protein
MEKFYFLLIYENKIPINNYKENRNERILSIFNQRKSDEKNKLNKEGEQ